MADYLLIRGGGCEGHDAPIMTMGEQDAHEFLLTQKHSYDFGLVIYRVPSIYDLRKDPCAEAKRVTLTDFTGGN